MDKREFYVDEDLCTGCGDCYKLLPNNFVDTGEDTAEVTSTEIEDMEKLEEIMNDCPGRAIKWKQ